MQAVQIRETFIARKSTALHMTQFLISQVLYRVKPTTRITETVRKSQIWQTVSCTMSASIGCTRETEFDDKWTLAI